MDPISLKIFMGASAAGGGASGLSGFEITDSNKAGSNLNAWMQADGSGNVYGCTDDRYFKVTSGGSLAWQYSSPSFYGSYPMQNMAVSQNGSYFVVCGQGGPTGYTGYGSRAGITKINPSTGATIKTFESQAGNLPLANTIANMADVVVIDSGICNGVGQFYRIFADPYHEFLRLAVNLSTESVLVNNGATGGTYFEYWNDVDMDSTYVAISGNDAQRPQAGFSQYNWTLGAAASTSLYFSKSYQSNAGNGVGGAGIAINSTNGYVYGGYRDAGGTRGIVAMQSNGNIFAYRSIYYASAGDLTINKLATDGTYIYFAGSTSAITGSTVRVIGSILASDGSFQWANYFTHATSSMSLYKLRYNAGMNALDVAMSPSSSQGKAVYFSIPVDGSGEGTAGDYTYTSVTLNKTDASVSWYSASPSFSSWTSHINTNTASSSTSLSVSTL